VIARQRLARTRFVGHALPRTASRARCALAQDARRGGRGCGHAAILRTAHRRASGRRRM
jgi:hypothetical protein